MRKRTTITSLTLLLTLPLSTAVFADNSQYLTSSRQAIGELGKELKTTMKRAMKQGGPLQAIKTCKLEASEIGKNLGHKKGWTVGRTSLRYRNPDNKPDAWEKTVLLNFEKRLQAGESPAKMEYSAIVDNNGQQTFRYMKAIPTAPFCLKCHGSKIAPAVQAELQKLYPNDQATGFKAGDIRGAFSVSQPLEK